MTDIDSAWLAGILEGEGHFGYNKRKYTLKTPGEIKFFYDPYVHLQMTDKDIVYRVASLFQSKSVRTYLDKRGNRKLLYRVGCNGKRRLPSLLKSIFPYMGERRKTKILILFFLIMDKQNFVNFMTENGMSFENADKTYEQLEERFDGDWKKAADYLQDVVKYLQKHQ
jgi:hypothetical protein